jgi:hypothetical protein
MVEGTVDKLDTQELSGRSSLWIFFKLSASHPEVFTDTWNQDYISVKHNLFSCCYIHLGDMFRIILSRLQAFIYKNTDPLMKS